MLDKNHAILEEVPLKRNFNASKRDPFNVSRFGHDPAHICANNVFEIHNNSNQTLYFKTLDGVYGVVYPCPEISKKSTTPMGTIGFSNNWYHEKANSTRIGRVPEYNSDDDTSYQQSKTKGYILDVEDERLQTDVPLMLNNLGLLVSIIRPLEENDSVCLTNDTLSEYIEHCREEMPDKVSFYGVYIVSHTECNKRYYINLHGRVMVVEVVVTGEKEEGVYVIKNKRPTLYSDERMVSIEEHYTLEECLCDYNTKSDNRQPIKIYTDEHRAKVNGESDNFREELEKDMALKVKQSQIQLNAVRGRQMMVSATCTIIGSILTGIGVYYKFAK